MPAPACSSSSLGNDSDEGSPGKEAEAGDGEVQSTYSGAGLAAGLGALEESLPIRRGISKFYNGKSKSFTFLREALTPSGSSRVIAKADNAYTRKRKNPLAYSIIYGKSHSTAPETYEGGTPKRLASLSRLRPLDSISSRSSSSSSLSSEENELPQQLILAQSPDITDNFAPPKIPVPWLVLSCAPKTLPLPMRSFSMMDLHCLHRSCSSVRHKEEQKAD